MEKFLDEEGGGEGYSGTFRWKRDKTLQSIPFKVSSENDEEIDVSSGWMAYFISRCSNNDELSETIKLVQEDLSIIDCISAPVSLAHVLHRTAIIDRDTSLPELQVVCIGCSAKAEERVVRETTSWKEFCLAMPKISKTSVWFVGPEMSSTAIVDDEVKFKRGSFSHVLSTNLFKGTTMEFFRSRPNLLSSNTVVVGLNCGFGNFENPLPKRYDLLCSWLPDLYFLTGTKLPLYFFCANDYADLYGELSVMTRILGARVVSPPGENPFGFASTFIPPASSTNPRSKKASLAPQFAEKEDVSEYSRGNSFWYAVQGSDRLNRKVVDLSLPDRVKTILSCLNLKNPLNLQEIPIFPIRLLSFPTLSSHPTEAEAKGEKSSASVKTEVDIAINELQLDLNYRDLPEKHNVSIPTLSNCFVQQQIRNQHNAEMLEVVIDLGTLSELERLDQLDLQVADSGSLLTLHDLRSCSGACMNSHPCLSIELERRIDRSQLIAKFSKKKMNLRIVAPCQ